MHTSIAQHNYNYLSFFSSIKYKVSVCVCVCVCVCVRARARVCVCVYQPIKFPGRFEGLKSAATSRSLVNRGYDRWQTTRRTTARRETIENGIETEAILYKGKKPTAQQIPSCPFGYFCSLGPHLEKTSKCSPMMTKLRMVYLLYLYYANTLVT